MAQRLLDHQVHRVVSRLCEDLGTPFALQVEILARYGEWDQIAELRVIPARYSDSESYWRDAVACSLLRKMVDLPTSFDRKGKAVESFFSSEKRCYRSNQRLARYIHGSHQEPDDHVLAFFSRARQHARRILGRPPVSYEGRHGPGATFADRGTMTTVPDKMSSSPTLTGGALGFLFPWAETAWGRAVCAIGKSPVFTQGNRFTTVPKDCTKDRGIAIEPSINLFYQLGISREIRGRLKSMGIDLQRGQEIHRRVACEASLTGYFATLDLSNASDTICTSLVRLVLPPEWARILEDLRSPRTLIDGKWVLLEKFSSMGNGFTFELETLIFLCLILAVDEAGMLRPGKDVYVYGDDMIFPAAISKEVIAVLEFCGLEVNRAKSFVDGPFRESCGGDFFEGVDVRPFFLEESPNEPQHLVAFANGIARLNEGNARRAEVTRGAWFAVLDSIPSSVRSCRGPKGLGDLVVRDDDESRWNFKWRHGIRYFRCYRPSEFVKIGWWGFAEEVVLAAALYGVGSGGESRHITTKSQQSPRDSWDSTGVTPRDAVRGHAVAWVAYS